MDQLDPLAARESVDPADLLAPLVYAAALDLMVPWELLDLLDPLELEEKLEPLESRATRDGAVPQEPLEQPDLLVKLVDVDLMDDQDLLDLLVLMDQAAETERVDNRDLVVCQDKVDPVDLMDALDPLDPQDLPAPLEPLELSATHKEDILAHLQLVETRDPTHTLTDTATQPRSMRTTLRTASSSFVYA